MTLSISVSASAVRTMPSSSSLVSARMRAVSSMRASRPVSRSASARAAQAASAARAVSMRCCAAVNAVVASVDAAIAESTIRRASASCWAAVDSSGGSQPGDHGLPLTRGLFGAGGEVLSELGLDGFDERGLAPGLRCVVARGHVERAGGRIAA